MKNLLKNIAILLICIVSIAGISKVYAAVVTPLFPGALNYFTEGEIIEEEDWNAIEIRIGENGTTTRNTLTFQVNDLMASTTMAQITTLLGLTSTGALNAGSISTGFGAVNIGADDFTTTGFSNLGNLLLTGSSTLQRFTFTNATGTSATTTNFFSTTASTTNFAVGTSLTAFGTAGTAWSDFCVSITGGSGLCDGTDDASAGGGTFAWTPTSYGVSTSTTLGFLNGFLSTASSTFTGGFRADQSTTTSATTTNFASTNICLTGDTCRTTWPSGSGGSFAWPFTKQADNSQGTTTIVSFLGGFYSSASSTLTNFLATNSTTTSATTTAFAISSIASSLLKTNTNGSIIPAVAGTDYENIITAGDGLTRTVNDFDCDIASGTIFGCLASADWTTFNNKLGSMTFAFPWLKLSTNENATSTTLAFLNGFLSTASSTLTNFTATNSTTTNATTTTFQTGTLGVGADYITDITGSGLSIVGGALTSAGGSSFAWPFTKLSTNEQATSTTLALLNGFLSTASSTFTGGFIANQSTTTQATTTNFFSTTLTATTGFFTNLWIGVDTLAEYIADTAGAMWTGNTETGGAITYQDADNTIDFVCNTATSGVFGCLASADWTTFNNKLGSYDAFTHPSIGLSATTTQFLIGTSTASNYQLTISSTTAPQLSLSSGAGIAQWAFRNAGGNLYFATTTVAGTATSTPAALELRNSGTGLGIATSTFSSSILGLGTTGSTNGTTTIAAGKIQFDGYNTAGSRICMFVVTTTLTIQSGACNQ